MGRHWPENYYNRRGSVSSHVRNHVTVSEAGGEYSGEFSISHYINSPILGFLQAKKSNQNQRAFQSV